MANRTPIAAAKDIRETFFRMAMNDEETVALIAGGHTFGKTHGAGDPSLIGPRSGRRRHRGFRASAGGASMARVLGADAITGGPEVTWTQTPTKVEQSLLRQPVQIRMGAGEEPGRCLPVEGERRRESHDPGCLRHVERSMYRPCWTTDLSLRFDPAYAKISRRFYEHPDEFADRLCPAHGSNLLTAIWARGAPLSRP